MKTTARSAFLLAALVPAALAATGFNHAAFERELEGLAKASRGEQLACHQVYDRANDIGGPVAPGDEPSQEMFVSKEVALKVARALDDYPGLPVSGGKVLEKLTTEPLHGVDFDLSVLFRLGDGKSVGYARLVRHLMASARHYTLSGDERVRVTRTVLHYLRKDAGTPMGPVDVMLRLGLLRQASDLGLVPLLESQKQALTDLEKTGQRTRDIAARTNREAPPEGLTELSYRELPLETRRKVNAGLLSELRAVDAVRAGYAALMATISSP